MTLLVIILTLILQRYLNWGETISRTAWLNRYLSQMQSVLQKTPLWSNIAGVIIIILPVLIVIGFFQWLFNGWFFSILKFIFDFAILWFCLDAYHLKNRLNDYFTSLVKDDVMTAREQGNKFVRAHTSLKFAGESLAGLARAVSCEIFVRGEEKIFGVLFWFIVLGPIGAVAYYLIVAIRDLAVKTNSPFVELLLPATQIFGVLDWIPVRLLGLSYALVGHFVTGFNYCRKNFLIGIERTTEFAINAGFAGLNMEHIDVIHADAEENQAALALIERAIFLWIVIVAIFTLGGWL